ncbi:MAG: DNA polymerase subunit beta [Candidatus Muproteobacteria bacterium RIFCSPHIGHO2_01_FULL_65_16]|uniref:DNA polymerase subunit beta n=1 Tax=Candidatus Muproteobacteria bacterium RIFCSPHIGHO2_01_FULL_65_16 TaxID=1817764 RepID=A0A1F6TQU0_9PROT|nr:MAG: DNA polymerase subunit beta [Candidatus Muproteobacteria bacterium RIFCSPHIGHO2_01_FULL_65_16]
MNRHAIEKLLAAHRAELGALGVRALSVFGSVARNEAGPQSDVDLLVEFEGTADFDRYMDLKFYLEDLLGRRVDLVTRGALRPRLQQIVEREAVRVA